MKLVLDAVGNRSGGGVTVLLDIIERAITFAQIQSITVLASPSHRRSFVFPKCDKLRIVDIPYTENIAGRLHWALKGLDNWLKRADCDVFLGLNGLGSVRKPCPSLVFVQQTLPYSQEAMRQFSVSMRIRVSVIRILTRRCVRAADHVIVQNEAMRVALSDACDISKDNISVFVPPAPSLPDTCRESRRLTKWKGDKVRGALLYVGTDLPHKNLGFVAEGLRCIDESRRPEWYVTLPSSATVCRQGSAIALGTLDREELCVAYQKATALVMASFTETVGLPMLEAMRVGTPVIAPKRPYAEAVCEDAAAYFDPHSPQDFASVALRLHSDTEWREELIRRGHAIVRRRDSGDSYRRMLEKVIAVAGEVNSGGREPTRSTSCDCQ